ncbi:MAG TPA: hypothetical protein VGD11_13060, partial [Mycobacteriales bacterium]
MSFSRRRELEAARTRARLDAVCPGTRPGEAGEWLLDPAGVEAGSDAEAGADAGVPGTAGDLAPRLPALRRDLARDPDPDAALRPAAALRPDRGLLPRPDPDRDPRDAARTLLTALTARFRADPGRRGVAALAVVAVLACAVAG